MQLGYNTNGLAHHELFDAVELLAGIGYRGVGVTVDHGVLSPRDDGTPGQLRDLRRLLDRHGMCSAIETGARFLLDPRQKHEPTLISADPDGRARRVEFYQHAVRCAAALDADCVSLWSGVLQDGASTEEAMDRLVGGLEEVLSYGAEQGVVIAMEPEPGMLVDSMPGFAELIDRIDSPNLALTLDVGHLHCQGETPIADQIHQWASRLANVHLEDMRRDVHEHLMFGQGEIEFPPVLRALAEVGYTGGVYVELSRHSHAGPTAAREAMEFLRPIFPGAE